ncbi:hypothetical protein AWR38_22910 [Idiomarina sp. WRN-38]|nr:hypothetical protein AUR68_22875 [Idiomarina sp. H105]OAE92351.1 hypothetical protein AWR38_22910 [Idiomarina sp. WRN-38]HBN59347.1 hypothetical protein [Halomonas sp.]
MVAHKSAFIFYLRTIKAHKKVSMHQVGSKNPAPSELPSENFILIRKQTKIYNKLLSDMLHNKGSRLHGYGLLYR